MRKEESDVGKGTGKRRTDAGGERERRKETVENWLAEGGEVA